MERRRDLPHQAAPDLSGKRRRPRALVRRAIRVVRRAGPEWDRPRLLLVTGGLFALALFAVGWLLVDPTDPPDLLLFVGRFHPMVVHFPIALLILAALLELMALAGEPYRSLREAAPFVLVLGAAAAIMAVIAGLLLSLEGGYEQEMIEEHRNVGIFVAIGAVVAAVLRIRGRGQGRPGRLLYAGTLGATVLGLAYTGHAGANLTHGPEYLFDYMPATLKRLGGLTGTAAAAPRITDIDSAYVFRDLVAPVLDARCVECHNPTKEKGGLQLDTPEALMEGGEDGPVVVAGQPEESELLRRITLPPSHEDFMPPDGARPLDVGETELIRWWIDHGASFDQRVADIEEVPTAVATLFNRIAPPRPEEEQGLYALDVEPADAAVLAKLRATGVGIDPVAMDLPLLQVSTVNRRGSFGDSDLLALAPIGRQVTWLDLGDTRVTDRGTAVFRNMPHLTRLSLAGTRVTDAGLANLRGLTNLEYLNLYGTAVTDAGLKIIQELPSLRSVYLWETGVSPEAVQALIEARPDLEVVVGTANASGPDA